MWGIPPPFCHIVRGKKGGQSPLSSIIYKKENIPFISKKYFWEKFCKRYPISKNKFLEKFYKNR
jgi:hypothetical protein